MSYAESSLWTKTVAIGLVVMAAVIGNVSLSASEPASRSARVPALSPSPDREMPAVASLVVPRNRLSGMGYSSFDVPPASNGGPTTRLPSEAAEETASSQAGGVVPAIYGWDPDVRFVFYRHVSKWM